MSLTFAGISSDAVNVVVERYPARPVPSRRYQVTQIPGRSGDLLFSEGSFANVTQEYEIYVREASGSTFQNSCRLAAEWLLLPVGYQRLEDSYDPDTFRLGYFVAPKDISNTLNQLGRATISFGCKPWRYLYSGEVVKTVSASPDSITNPAGFDALPKIVVHGSGAGVLGIGDYTVAISAIDDGMVIDCETMNTYNGAQNRNNLITLSPTFEYPRLTPGATMITFSGGITSVEITPRWRTL